MEEAQLQALQVVNATGWPLVSAQIRRHLLTSCLSASEVRLIMILELSC